MLSPAIQRIIYHVRRNFLSALFPTTVGTLIYLDYSHTQKYKERLKLESA